MNVLKVIGCSMTLCALPLSGQTGGGTELFRDMKAPQHERIMDLLSRLTVEEKISLLVNDAPAIGRLGIDKYNHGNEALHGVVQRGFHGISAGHRYGCHVESGAIVSYIFCHLGRGARTMERIGIRKKADSRSKRLADFLVAYGQYGP